MKTFFCLLMICGSVFATGCVTSYKGPMPDLTLRGEAAEKEIQQYTLTHQGVKVLSMGAEKTNYWKGSLLPVVETVSPLAHAEMKRSNWWFHGSYLILASAVLVLTADLSGDHDLDSEGLYYGLIGASIGVSGYSYYVNSRATKQYNQDLRTRLTPQISYRWEF
jgi:hypothetical protein